MRAILVDLDGTVLDRSLSLRLFLEDQYERLYGLRHIKKGDFIRRFTELDAEGYVWKDQVYACLIKEFGIAADRDELLNDYVGGFWRFATDYPNCRHVLMEMKERGYKLGMITNGKRGFQRANIEALGMTDLFDTIIVSEEAGCKKPDICIFRLALQELRVNPGEAVYIGDHPINDIEAAYKAGMTGIWKKNQTVGRFETKYVLEEWPQLYSILEKVKRDVRV
ncbi:MAG: HAD family hydrolase [Bacillus sp. (in: firmicutes)]